MKLGQKIQRKRVPSREKTLDTFDVVIWSGLATLYTWRDRLTPKPKKAANMWRKIVSPTSKAKKSDLPMNSLTVYRMT